jgi:2-keto-3-deoxy-6-phosphogluconate aldolase
VAGGGVTPDNMAGWKQAGATGFGIGGKLYTPGVALDELRRRAEAFSNGAPGALWPYDGGSNSGEQR